MFTHKLFTTNIKKEFYRKKTIHLKLKYNENPLKICIRIFSPESAMHFYVIKKKKKKNNNNYIEPNIACVVCVCMTG